MAQTSEYGLLVVDIQGKLARMVQKSELYIQNTSKLVRCVKLLSVPIICIEQNPKGLGETVPEIANLLLDVPLFTKLNFNALNETSIREAIKSSGKKKWLVVGIEAHVCIYQTVLGLLQEGYEVEVVSDCLSSRLQSNIDLALINMREAGAKITSLEMCIFQLMQTCELKQFKSVLSVIK